MFNFYHFLFLCYKLYVLLIVIINKTFKRGYFLTKSTFGLNAVLIIANPITQTEFELLN
ncbi:unnamed protein product [Brugia timori]|uniref:Uncharacterized protein n=1 Tax=Brugia timori TaxID=42155 RepID=A0A3P7U1J0_9BILA|nr:unnamed protein product [Brugia timori]